MVLRFYLLFHPFEDLHQFSLNLPLVNVRSSGRSSPKQWTFGSEAVYVRAKKSTGSDTKSHRFASANQQVKPMMKKTASIKSQLPT